MGTVAVAVDIRVSVTYPALVAVTATVRAAPASDEVTEYVDLEAPATLVPARYHW